MRQEESQTDLGVVRIHNNVIASIASIAATEIPGVKGIAVNFKTSILQIFGKKTAAIKIETDARNQINIKIPLIILYGYNIRDVAERVEENIRNALEKMTNISIKNIYITIKSIEKGGST